MRNNFKNYKNFCNVYYKFRNISELNIRCKKNY